MKEQEEYESIQENLRRQQRVVNSGTPSESFIYI
jgi:hypothetical protein